MLPVVVWDVGGTLVDRISHEEGFARSLLEARVHQDDLHPDSLSRVRKEHLRIESHWRTLADEAQGFRSLAALMLEESPFANSNCRETLAARLACYERHYSPIPGIPQFLDELRQLGYRQAIVSNWPPSLLRFLDYHGLRGYFEVMVGSCAEGMFKPNRRLFECALERLNVRPDDAIYIGNDPGADMVPARALGFRTIHFDPRREHPDADTHEVTGLRNLLGAMLKFPQDGAATLQRPI